jgi:hypothetical protein
VIGLPFPDRDCALAPSKDCLTSVFPHIVLQMFTRPKLFKLLALQGVIIAF